MEEIYRLGKHEFATKEEWEGAKRDLEKIETIVKNLDIDNPDVAEDIYHFIREGKVEFESKIGTAFFCDISDRVAQNFEHELERSMKLERRRLRKEKEQEKKEQEKQRIKETQQSQMFKFLGIACIVLSAICVMFYGFSVYRERRAAKKLEEVQQQRSITQALDWYADRIKTKEREADPPQAAVPSETQAASETEQTLEVLPEYSIMHRQYPDLVGWISIDDTQIDLPVMQAEDNAYYLDKDVNGSPDVNGTLFMDCRNDFVKPSTNLIIYGHNMKSGAMFGGLKQYLEESYLLSHGKIRFDTIYEKQTYQIIAVCLSDVGDEGAYRYYNFIEAESDEDFDAFLANIRNCAVYDSTQDVTRSDSLLTLSTCNNYVEDGRLFLVAKKLQ